MIIFTGLGEDVLWYIFFNYKNQIREILHIYFLKNEIRYKIKKTHPNLLDWSAWKSWSGHIHLTVYFRRQ